MNRLCVALVPALFPAFLVACGSESAVESGDEDAVGEAREALVQANALAPNALAPNALAPNALAPNALAPNALAPNALAPNSLTILQAGTADGAQSRQLLKYTVSCALSPAQSFSFTWTDTYTGSVHTETYQGSLGLAPTWATAPLTDDTQQRLVSSCLAARANWYGASVLISLRSQEQPLKSTLDDQELTDYSYVEGAFWGNLFVTSPYLNACYNPDNVAHSRAALRDCATGHLTTGISAPQACGMITLAGSCASLCNTFNSNFGAYITCIDHPEIASSPWVHGVITTALP